MVEVIYTFGPLILAFWLHCHLCPDTKHYGLLVSGTLIIGSIDRRFDILLILYALHRRMESLAN